MGVTPIWSGIDQSKDGNEWERAAFLDIAVTGHLEEHFQKSECCVGLGVPLVVAASNRRRPARGCGLALHEWGASSQRSVVRPDSALRWCASWQGRAYDG